MLVQVRLNWIQVSPEVSGPRKKLLMKTKKTMKSKLSNDIGLITNKNLDLQSIIVLNHKYYIYYRKYVKGLLKHYAVIKLY